MDDRTTIWDKVRSVRHAAALALSERIGRFRVAATETPAGELDALPSEARARAVELAARYGCRFELQQDASGAFQAYEYLDILDQALCAWQVTPPSGITMHDVGCASFAYASALVALCKPSRLIGVELEGYRRLRGGVNRAEKAATNVARLPGASFVVADYTKVSDPVDLVTAFFPFVTPAPVLGWRLPLSVLRPKALFDRIRDNIGSAGSLWMVNHGEAEASVAAGYASRSGLALQDRYLCTSTLRLRAALPVVSAWRAKDQSR